MMEDGLLQILLWIRIGKTLYIMRNQEKKERKLLSKFPDSLDRVFFVNSGSAAADLAIRMARTHTGNQSIMVMEHGYHGHTQTGIDISDYKFSSIGGEGQKDFILKAYLPDTYKGKYMEAMSE